MARRCTRRQSFTVMFGPLGCPPTSSSIVGDSTKGKEGPQRPEVNEWAYLVRRHQSALATRQWVPQELEAGAREFTEGLSFVIVQKNARHRHVSRAIGTTADGELFRGADGKPRPERAITHAT